MELLQFIPMYPSIDSTSFFQDIYQKKEFYELRRRRLDGHFYSHQHIIARFVSQWTLYDALLLIHDTGTGKSSSAAAVFDHLVRLRPKMKTLYLSNNETLIENFKTEILRRSPLLNSTWKQFTKKIALDDENFVIYRNKLLRQAGIECMTYSRFASLLTTTAFDVNAQLFHKYKSGLIILDEVHHLVVRQVEKSDVPDTSYKEIHRFLHMIPDKKVLLMTATPMRNSPSEIAPLFNLILPLDRQFVTGERFIDEYFDVEHANTILPVLEWRQGKENEFLKQIQGFVSVVKQNVDVTVRYEGFVYKPLDSFPLVCHSMSVFQTLHYGRAIRQDTQAITEKKKTKIDGSFYSHSVQASLFVFPNGKWGMTSPYFEGTTNRRLSLLFFQETKMKRKAKTPEDIAYNLDILKTYSVTYHAILSQILFRPYELSYVYCDKINGSGILTCVMILVQCFDFSLLRSPKGFQWSHTSRRCIFLNDTERGTTKADIPKLIDIFNDERNKYGDFVQVIFGTDKTREGITLKRIQQIHIASPDWNFGKIFQAIGRGVRLQSHQGMGSDVVVRIFLHCAVPHTKNDIKTNLFTDVTTTTDEDEMNEEENDPFEELPSTSHIDLEKESDTDEEDDESWLMSVTKKSLPPAPVKENFTHQQLAASIDFYRYLRSELRDKNIKLVEYAMLIGAVDCQLNYHDNVKLKGVDYSTECMYKPCDYSCRGITDKNPPTLDESTYNLFYSENILPELVKDIQSYFFNHESQDFETLCVIFQQFDQRQIMNALLHIVETPLPILQKDRRVMYLFRHGDVFYLLDDRFPPVLTTSTYCTWLQTYASKPSFNVSQSFQEILSSFLVHNDVLVPYLEAFFHMADPQECWDTLPQRVQTQIIVVVLRVLQGYEKSTSDMSLSHVWIENALKSIFKNILNYNEEDKQWEYRTSEASYVLDNDTHTTLVIDNIILDEPVTEKTHQDHDDPQFIETYVTNNPYKFYVFADGKGFKIRDVRRNESEIKDLKSKTKGKECTSYPIAELVYFLWKLGERFPTQPLTDTKKTDTERWRDISTLPFPSLKTLVNKLPLWNEFLGLLKKDETHSDEAMYRMFAYFHKFNRRFLCQRLFRYCQEKGLVVKPPLEKSKVKK